MAEYISREEAIDKMRSLKSSFRAKNDWDSGYDTAIAEAFEHIKRVPVADVKTEIHAYWIRGKEFGFKTHNPIWYCSNCGGSIRYDTTLRTYQKHKKSVEKVNCFCRKCGAKMDLPPIYERNISKESEE